MSLENENNFIVNKFVEVKADLLEFFRLCESSCTKLKLGRPVFLSFFVIVLNLVLQLFVVISAFNKEVIVLMFLSDTELIKPGIVLTGCVARNNIGHYPRKMIWSKI